MLIDRVKLPWWLKLYIKLLDFVMKPRRSERCDDED